MAQHFGDDHLNMLLQKQVYPYDYFDGPHIFQETELLPISAFTSSLTGEDIAQEAYDHAQTAWKDFQIHNFGEYSDLYVL